MVFAKYLSGLVFLLPILFSASIKIATFSGRNNPNRAAFLNQKTTNATLVSRISVPEGYVRIPAPARSYLEYLRSLSLKPAGAKVFLYNGQPKGNQEAQVAVFALPIGTRDLQQCADAVMRLRAEYLFKKREYKAIHFNFTSGDRADYEKYAAGYRAIIKGNSVTWVKQAPPDTSYATFRKYLDLVFSYAGTASLEKELTAKPDLPEIAPGDVFIQGGFPGHAVTVVDVAQNVKTGHRIFYLRKVICRLRKYIFLKTLLTRVCRGIALILKINYIPRSGRSGKIS